LIHLILSLSPAHALGAEGIESFRVGLSKMGKKSRRKQRTLKGATTLMEPRDEVQAAIHTLTIFETLVVSGRMEKAIHLESKVLDAIKVRLRDVRPGGTCSIDPMIPFSN
jgi:hypothetical protein